MSNQNIFEHVNDVIKLCEQAGQAIMQHYQSDDLQSQIKIDDANYESPVTQADLAAHKVLVQGLAKITPDIPVLSEESTDSERSCIDTKKPFWLVDPLDGTKAFIAGTGSFTVNVGLIIDHKPVFGVVYDPVAQVTYATVENDKAVRIEGKQTTPISASTTDHVQTIVASKHHLDPISTRFIKQFPDANLITSDSSLKICRVAEGAAELYPRLTPSAMEWDTAAADAVLRATGGKLVDTNLQPLTYGIEPSLRSPGFIAHAPNLNFSPPN